MDHKTVRGWADQALAEKPYPDPRFPPSPYYRFLKIAAQNLKPELSVELGVCGGGGSFHLAIGNPAGLTVGIDIAADHPENVSFILAQCPNFRFWLGSSTEVAKDVYEEYGLKIGLLFVDTTHTYKQTWNEIEAWKPYLADNFMICFDDLLRPEMVGFWESLPEPKLRIDELHSGAESGGGFCAWWS